MEAMIIVVLVVILIVGVVIFTRMSAVRLTSKEVIMNSVSEASSQLSSYRFDVKGFIDDRMGMYTTNEAGALAARRTSIERKRQDIINHLARAEEYLEPYQKAAVHRRFYDAASAALGSMKSTVNTIDEIQRDADAVCPVIDDIVAINAVTMHGSLAFIQSEGSLEELVATLQDITSKLAAAMKRNGEVRCETDEFHAVVQSLDASLQKVYRQYDELYRYAVADKRDELIEKHRAVSNFLSNFDMTSHGHIISAPFMASPEDQYVRDARALQYE